MFDVGFWEILLIGIVALVVVGPERLPEVARTVGKWVAKTRRFVAGVKSDINAELESGELHKILGAQKEQIQELKTMVDSTRKELESSTKDAVSSAKENFEDIQRKAKEATATSGSGMQATSTAATGSAALAAKTPDVEADFDDPGADATVDEPKPAESAESLPNPSPDASPESSNKTPADPSPDTDSGAQK